MSTGKGIAVAGIWLGVGMCGLSGPGQSGIAWVAVCALIATLAVVR